MKISQPWLKVVLIVALTIVLTAVACIICLGSDAGIPLVRIMFYVGPLLGFVALYYSRFRGPVMVGTSDSIISGLARELMARGYLIEKVKGRLNVRIDRSVGVAVILRQKGQRHHLYYRLETMPRGAAWIIILFLFAPPIALFVVVYYVSKVIRFGGESLDGIALKTSQRLEGQEKSVKEMLIEGISEARRISIEAYEATKSNRDDMLVLSVASGLLSMIVTVFSLLHFDATYEVAVHGAVALFAGVVAFVTPVALSYVLVRRRYMPKLGRLKAWGDALSSAFESEGHPTGGEITPDSHFELLAEASGEVPGWLKIRRKSMLAREPGWTMVMLWLIYLGALATVTAAIYASQESLGGLIVLCVGIIMICLAVVVYTITARRMASEAKAFEDNWRRRSEQMKAEMENLLGGKAPNE